MAENSISYDGGPWQYTVSILEFRGDKVAHESIYITAGWDPPEWRAPWRSEPGSVARTDDRMSEI